MLTGLPEVKKKIASIYLRRRAAAYALSLQYAALALKYFRSVQPSSPNTKGLFWTNRTGQAAARMFTQGIKEDNVVGWLMAHAVQYGVYLEKANNRRYQSIRPIIQRFAGRYLAAVRRLYSDN